MANQPQDPSNTSLKHGLTKQDKEAGSLYAERIVYTAAFPMVLKAALELGVIDTVAVIDEGIWLSSSEIAHRLPNKPTNPEAPALLDRMLVLLASHSILKHRTVENVQTGKPESVYAAEPVCMFFLNRGDGSGSLMYLLQIALSDVFFKTWEHLKDLILEGKDAFRSAHGKSIFEYIGSNEQFARMFNKAMSEASTMTMKNVLEVYKGFEDVNTLVDVGGGTGTIMGLVTSKYPHIKAINFDLPSVLTHVPLNPGVEHVAGDMFIEIPKADAIFMKWILHDWPDEDCVKILRNCWRSLPERGKVILVDMIRPVKPVINDISSNIVFCMDMLMLTQCSGGKERSFSQVEALASDSGFRRCEMKCHVSSYSVVELYK